MTDVLNAASRAAVLRAWCSRTTDHTTERRGEARGLDTTVAVSGISMLPTLSSGDRVHVDTTATPRVGDVIVFADGNDNLVVHRLVVRRRDSYRCLGDNRLTFDDPVGLSAVVGVVATASGPDGRLRPVRRTTGIGWFALLVRSAGAVTRGAASRVRSFGRPTTSSTRTPSARTSSTRTPLARPEVVR